jgi:CRISPR-associated protein Csb1
VRRESVLNLVALRALAANTTEATESLRRYVLGLALVALTAPLELFLREGCLLVPAVGEKTARNVVSRSGVRSPFDVTAASALEFAQSAAAAFGVGPNWPEAAFDGELVKAAAKAKKEKKEKKTKAGS